MLAGMQPDTGGRFTARLLEQDEIQARFRLELATSEGAWSAQAEVQSNEGTVSWGAWEGTGEPPEWLCQYTRAALRGAWRQHREQGWPRRLTRWRDVPSHGRSRDGNPDE